MRMISIMLVFIVLFSFIAVHAEAQETICGDPASKHESKEDDNHIDYSDDELNMIANLVDGEVGRMSGYITITYYDGTTDQVDGATIHRIHARVVHNQVQSDMFPDSLSSCLRQYWSKSYTRTGYRSNSQWIECREDAVEALSQNTDNVPSNVFGATCDPYFDQKYTSYHRWATVRWNTGWVSGTFYYYYYGELEIVSTDIDECKEIITPKRDRRHLFLESHYIEEVLR